MSDKEKLHDLEAAVIEAIKRVFDPEIPVNIYDLGLIYDVRINDDATVDVLMTLTTPNCPEAESLPYNVLTEVKKVEGVKDVDVKLTFEPPWSKDLMTEAALLELGFL